MYNITYKVLNSFDYNVPQKRERIFIIGTIKTKDINFEFPSVVNDKKLLKDVLYNVPVSPGSKYSDEKIKLFKMIPQVDVGLI